MTAFKLKSLAAPKSASGSTCMVTDLIKFVLEYNDLLIVITIMNLISKNTKVKNKCRRYRHD